MVKKVDMPLEDQETIINYSKYHLGEWCEVYTTDKVVMKRYEKFCKEHPEYARVIKDDKYSMTFTVHPKCASVYPKAPRKVKMSEERKETLREQLRNLKNK